MNKGDIIRIYDCEGHVPEHRDKMGEVNAIQNGRVHSWIDDGNPAGRMSCWPTKFDVIVPNNQ